MRRSFLVLLGFACALVGGCGGAGEPRWAVSQCPPRGEGEPLVGAAARAMRPRADGEAAFRVSYLGTLEMEGHYRRPGETRPFRAEWHVTTDGGAYTRLEFRTWEGEDRSKASVETTWLAGSEVVRRDDEGEPYRSLEGFEAQEARALVEAALPSRAIDRWAGGCGRLTLLGGSDDGRGRRLERVRPEEGPSRATTLWLEPGAGALARVEREYGHPRLGDVRDQVDYGRYAWRGQLRVPETVVLRQHRRDESFRAELRLLSVETKPGEAGALVASAREAAAQAATGGVSGEAAGAASGEAAGGAGGAATGGAGGAATGGAAGLGVREIGPGVFEIVSEAGDVRGLVVEFKREVVAIEAPLTSELGERFVDAIGARFPGKKIASVLFSHYHPHYTGGLRAFLAAGASVVAPPGGARFAEQLAGRSFTRSPDRLARAPAGPARVRAFEGSWVLDDGTNRLEAYDIGAASSHTDEYVVFYLPRAGLLFEGDLGFFGKPGGGVRVGRRAKGLLGAIEAKGLRVERLVQAWPIKGSPASVGFAEWKALVGASEAAR
ncbi:MAG TPA: MBL fold metallo-hydrolase [Polyangiaceae bacterium]|nr:MBL fold metallo-hydrolase [Polyangiaceae bacterium]